MLSLQQTLGPGNLTGNVRPTFHLISGPHRCWPAQAGLGTRQATQSAFRRWLKAGVGSILTTTGSRSTGHPVNVAGEEMQPCLLPRSRHQRRKRLRRLPRHIGLNRCNRLPLVSRRQLIQRDLLQSWGPAEKALWPGPDQAAIPNRPAMKAA
jgi:hypothetical protein